MPDKATPAGKPQLLANARIERLPVITAVGMKPMLTTFELSS